MYKLESVLENKAQKILWNSEIQTDDQIKDRRPNLVLINKKITCHIVDLADHREKVKEVKKL